MMLTSCKCLCITCDNASPNDTMIDVLRQSLDEYPGDANRARCFNHVIALVGKRMTRQFDVAKGAADAALDEAEKELRDLAKGMDIEEMLTKAKQDDDEEDEDDDKDDDDEMEDDMSPEEREELDASTRPVRLVLVKVSNALPFGTAHLIWMDCVAPKDYVRHDQVYNNNLAGVVPDTGEVGIERAQDAT
jgi:hypothetical protein